MLISLGMARGNGGQGIQLCQVANLGQGKHLCRVDITMRTTPPFSVPVPVPVPVLLFLYLYLYVFLHAHVRARACGERCA